MWDFLHNYWAVAALILSEVLAFLPTKVNSIAQAVIKIGTAIFGQKENTAVKSANQKVINKINFHS
jgi:hypothetical protein